MLSKKIFLSAALVSMASFVACGDDSSSNSGDGKLPEKVPTLEKALKLPCDEALKCEKVFVEEENINDYFQCDGERWQPITAPKFTDLCSAKKEGSNSEGTEEGCNNDGNSSDSNGSSSDSEGSSSDSDSNSSDSNADSADSNEGSSDSSASSTNSGEELTGPTGAVVSCLQEMTMEFMGETISTQSCSEIAADSKDVEAMKASCQSEEGFITATLGTGCPATYTKKCVIDNENVAYFYEAANANQDCADLIQKK